MKVRHLWSSDICPGAQEFIRLNHRPDHVFEDCADRIVEDLPRADCLVIGFPCQPFSVLGLKKGFTDSRMRVYHSILQTLRSGKVRSAIIENVGNLRFHNHGRSARRIMADIEDAGFRVKCRAYVASDFGLPQRRIRLYFVAIKRDEGCKPCLPDPPCVPVRPVSSLLDNHKGSKYNLPTPRTQSSTANKNLEMVLETLRDQGHHPSRETWVVDVEFEASATHRLHR